MAENNEALSPAKPKRRSAKALLTGSSKTLVVKLEHERPSEEITETFNKVKHAYDNFVAKHEEYVQRIKDDGAFEAEERWLYESQDAYLKLEITTNDYIRKIHETKPQAVSGSMEQPEVSEEMEVNNEIENNGNEVQPDIGQPETVQETMENEQQVINAIDEEENPDNSSV